MNVLKICMSTILLIALATSAQATLTNDKITLKPNMTVIYNELPEEANTFGEIFTNAVPYIRLRTNMFYFDWENDTENSRLKDHRAMGIGGSVVIKTAPYAGVSATVAGYTSQNPGWFREDYQDVGFVKSGKDTFSRYNVRNDGDYGMTVLGQAYLQYDIGKTSVIAGRQLFESVFTKSNDTKMIPNTFDGVSLINKSIPKTTIKLAYFTAQKLRDHTKSHDVIAFNSTDKWAQNDDAGVNRNLTVDRIGDTNELIIASVTNKSIKNLKVNLSYAMVPDVLSNITLESHYTIPISKNWKIVPGIRYMQQFDDLDANYNVANLLGRFDGYSLGDRKSLDGSLIAVRLDIKNKAFLGRIGYSKIADDADIVAPWRGFPTGGFTRAMGQYNWFANTKTYMFRAGYDFGKANILPGFSVMARYAIQDTDDSKYGVLGDSDVIHIDVRQNIGKNLELKFRMGIVNYDTGITGIKDDGTMFEKKDLSYNEYRFELNYFF
jgi:hypothetical protein